MVERKKVLVDGVRGASKGMQRPAHPVIGLAVSYHLRDCD